MELSTLSVVTLARVRQNAGVRIGLRGEREPRRGFEDGQRRRAGCGIDRLAMTATASIEVERACTKYVSVPFVPFEVGPSVVLLSCDARRRTWPARVPCPAGSSFGLGVLHLSPLLEGSSPGTPDRVFGARSRTPTRRRVPSWRRNGRRNQREGDQVVTGQLRRP